MLDPKPIGKVKITTEVVPGYESKGIKGGEVHHIAMKNKTSFLVGTEDTSIKLIEDGYLVFSGSISFNQSFLGDLIFCRKLNCYFINCDKYLYRKDIDKKTPLSLHLHQCVTSVFQKPDFFRKD